LNEGDFHIEVWKIIDHKGPSTITVAAAAAAAQKKLAVSIASLSWFRVKGKQCY
jgi:flavin-binding protein dodecin